MKEQFTAEGAAKLVANLYQLPQKDLANEAAAFSRDLKTWLSEHFELNTHQVVYLAKLNEQACDFYAQLGGFAMLHRLPIALDVAALATDPPPSEDTDEQGKIVYTKNSMTTVANGEGEMQPVGELTYCIRY